MQQRSMAGEAEAADEAADEAAMDRRNNNQKNFENSLNVYLNIRSSHLEVYSRHPLQILPANHVECKSALRCGYLSNLPPDS
eukprot:768737-Hanusia_phi.AAC.13